jgi:hypothetical protein
MREKVEREGVGGHGGSGGKRSEFLQNIDQISTSFYFTNFPEDLKSGDLWEVFVKFGNVVDVYIPSKVDKRGKRFGFVKFKDVLDVEEMSRSLDDVWCGSFKLRINHSRFGRNEVSKGTMKSGLPSRSVGDSRPVQHELSFKEALFPSAHWRVSSGEDRDSAVVKVPVDATQLQILKRSFVGFLRPEVQVKVIRTTLLMEGLQNISVIPMGGSMVLLQSTRAGELERIIKAKEEWIGVYFFNVKPWSPNLVNQKRQVWVKVFGIPLHAWGDTLFRVLGERFGEFVDYDEATAARSRMDVARLKFSTSIRSRIEVPVVIAVLGITFEVWVVEEEMGTRVVVEEEGERGGDRSWGGSSGFPRHMVVACGDDMIYGEEADEDEVDSVDLPTCQLERDNTQLLARKDHTFPMTSNHPFNNLVTTDTAVGVGHVAVGTVEREEGGARGKQVVGGKEACVAECVVSETDGDVEIIEAPVTSVKRG